MSGSTAVAYNPNDPRQQALLAAINAGEASPTVYPNPYVIGTGGVNLSGAPTDAYGFPIWSGTGNSHAAGAFQFQPGTWDSIASQYNLNFQNPADQNAGAWYNAQQAYAANTNGGSLYDALGSGNPGQVTSALGGQWTGLSTSALETQLAQYNPVGGANYGSGLTVGADGVPTINVTPQGTTGVGGGVYGPSQSGADTSGTYGPGSAGAATGTTGLGSVAAAAPGYLPPALTGGPEATGLTPGLATGIGEWVSGLESTFSSTISGATTWMGTKIANTALGAVQAVIGPVENLFLRGLIVLVAVVLLGVALWALLAKATGAPGPAETMRSAATMEV
jgi:muramidase (phage lysozyme)